jgi:hypothetical protein
MTIKERKKSLKNLGRFLSQFSRAGIQKKKDSPNNEPFFEALKMLIDRAQEQNPWFTKDNVLYALEAWADALQPEKIDKWFKQEQIDESKNPKKIGVVMAGNIPLVGFHDFLSVLATGHQLKAKLSQNDKYLLPLLAKYLISLNPEYKDQIEFVDGQLKDIDAVIATGSNNTARYFDYYFGKYPHIIRKNRNSVAVLTGEETEKELSKLADDIMRYFGLGCRNVSKIFVPKGYNFNLLFKALLKYKDLINYPKYANNYDYNKAVYIMSVDKDVRNSLLDNDLVLLKKNTSYSSPIGTLFYEYYDNPDEVKKIIEHDKDKIQAVVSKMPGIKNAIPFGSTQTPQLWDYADGVNTIQFLKNL